MAVLPFLYRGMDVSLGQIFKIPEPYALLFFSVLITLFLTLCYKYFTDQHVLRSLKERTSALQKKLKENKDNPAKISEIQKQLLETNFEYLGRSLKPTMITFLPLIIIFGWLKQYYGGMGNPDVLILGSFGLGWLGSYIVFSILSSLIFRKLLKVA